MLRVEDKARVRKGEHMIGYVSALAVLGICSYEDIKNRSVHTGLLLLFTIEGILLWVFAEKHPVVEIVQAILPGLSVLLAAFITKGSIGEGDGVILLIIGLLLGGAFALRIFMYALFFCACYAIFLLIIRKKNRKYEIAFVPFMLLAYIGEVALQNL